MRVYDLANGGLVPARATPGLDPELVQVLRDTSERPPRLPEPEDHVDVLDLLWVGDETPAIPAKAVG